jgi:hypothetical protein
MVKRVATQIEAIHTAKQFLYWAWFVDDAVRRGAITSETFTDEIPAAGGVKLSWPPAHRCCW